MICFPFNVMAKWNALISLLFEERPIMARKSTHLYKQTPRVISIAVHIQAKILSQPTRYLDPTVSSHAEPHSMF